MRNKCVGVALLLVVCAALTGCGFSQEVTVSDEFRASVDKPRTVAVMEFAARAFDRQRTGSVVWGIVKAPNAAEGFPALAASVLDGHLGMKTIPRTTVAEAMKIAKVKERQLLTDKDYKRVQELTKADAIVVGRVDRWRQSYVLLVPKGSIEYEMKCLELPNGKELWMVHSDCSMSGTDDRTVALEALKDAMEALEKKVKSSE